MAVATHDFSVIARSARDEAISAGVSCSRDCFASLAMTTEKSSRPLGMGLGAQVEGAARPDIVEMGVEKTPRRALAVEPQHLEEIEIGRHLAVAVEVLAHLVEYDAMRVDAPILPRAGAARQLALVDHAVDEVDGAV